MAANQPHRDDDVDAIPPAVTSLGFPWIVILFGSAIERLSRLRIESLEVCIYAGCHDSQLINVRNGIQLPNVVSFPVE
jgi:hypothetical protein